MIPNDVMPLTFNIALLRTNRGVRCSTQFYLLVDKVAETRMPICDYGTKKWRKLVKSSSHGAVDAISSILIFFDIEGDHNSLKVIRIF
jgi:hypothetical protein